jgi:hypothetical protein
VFFVCADEDDLFIEVHLAPLPLLARIKNAIGYILGRRSPYGDFEEIILSSLTALELGDKLVMWSTGETNAFSPNDVF